MKKIFIYILFFSFAFWVTSNGATPIILTHDNDNWHIRGEHVDYLQDIENKLSIYDVTNEKYEHAFFSGKNEESENYNKAITYWARVDIINTCNTYKHWVIEIFEPKIEHLELYIINSEGKLTLYRGGSDYSFYRKLYFHKNYIFDLPIKPEEHINIYLKIKVKRRGVMLGVVQTVNTLVGYASSEYFALALFYGIAIAMIFGNLFLYLLLSDKAYLYYIFYIIAISAYSLSLDGLGFQYIWPYHPEWNEYVYPIATYCMITCALLYARRFLNTKELSPSIIDNGIIALLLMRTFIFSLWFIHPGFGFLSWIDLIPLLYVYLTGVYLWLKGFRPARFYVLAFTLFFSGFLLSILQSLHLIKANVFTNYSFNIGVLGEMVMLSLALADRIKMLTNDKEIAQKEIIQQLKEKEHIIERSNRELENKVLERTKALEDKNKELDTFVYRSSHDIKGPLKSIIGATSLAMIEVDHPLANNYFTHILNSSKKLDNVVDHLLSVIEIKEMQLEICDIDIYDLVNATTLAYDQSFKGDLKIDISIRQEKNFYSDKELLKAVIENLVQTALLYKNPDVTIPHLKIVGEVDQAGARISFSDNGLGIDKSVQEKIFDIFQKTTHENSDNTLTLYMTKIYIEKLGGVMFLESQPGEGSRFTLNFKNYSNLVA